MKRIDTDILEKLGLTTLEAKVYMFILGRGITKVSNVYKSLGLDKSSTYRIIDNLIQKKLLTGLGEEYGQQVMISDPNLIIELAKQKKQEAEVVLHDTFDFVNKFIENNGELYKRQNISVYEGIDSYRIIMEKKLEIKPELIREIDNAGELPTNYPYYWDYMKTYVKRRVENGTKLLSLVPLKDKDQELEQTDPKLIKKVKYLPSDFKINVSISTFGDYTAIMNLKGGRRLGILIKDNLITELINSMFDLIWKITD